MKFNFLKLVSRQKPIHWSEFLLFMFSFIERIYFCSSKMFLKTVFFPNWQRVSIFPLICPNWGQGEWACVWRGWIEETFWQSGGHIRLQQVCTLSDQSYLDYPGREETNPTEVSDNAKIINQFFYNCDIKMSGPFLLKWLIIPGIKFELTSSAPGNSRSNYQALLEFGACYWNSNAMPSPPQL